MFTMFESETVCMMYLLDLCFSQLEVFKPATSKEGNSEVYVICLDFKRTEWLEKYLTDTKVSPVTCARYCVGTRLKVSLCSPRPSLYYISQSANNPNSLVGTSSYVFYYCSAIKTRTQYRFFSNAYMTNVSSDRGTWETVTSACCPVYHHASAKLLFYFAFSRPVAHVKGTSLVHQ